MFSNSGGRVRSSNDGLFSSSGGRVRSSSDVFFFLAGVFEVWVEMGCTEDTAVIRGRVAVGLIWGLSGPKKELSSKIALNSAMSSGLDKREAVLQLAGPFAFASFFLFNSCFEIRFLDLKGEVVGISGRTGSSARRTGSLSGEEGFLLEPLHPGKQPNDGAMLRY